MFELINDLSSVLPVSGAEDGMTNFITSKLEGTSLSVTKDLQGNLLVKSPETKVMTLICIPMDVPGLLCLYKEGKTAYLSPSSPECKKMKDFRSVRDESGTEWKLSVSGYNKESLCIKNCDLKLGAALCYAGKPVQDEQCYKGLFASRLALLAIGIKLCRAIKTRSVGICFTAGFYANYASEAQVANREMAENLILLGSCENKTDSPLILVKDGKHFPSKELMEVFSSKASAVGVAPVPFVTDQSATAADRTFPSHCPKILSLALPCAKLLGKEESVSKSAAEKLLNALLTLI